MGFVRDDVKISSVYHRAKHVETPKLGVPTRAEVAPPVFTRVFSLRLPANVHTYPSSCGVIAVTIRDIRTIQRKSDSFFQINTEVRLEAVKPFA